MPETFLKYYLVCQGGRKLISDGGSLFIRKKNLECFFPIISNFLLYETQKVGAPRDTRDPQFRPPEVCVLSITNSSFRTLGYRS